MKKFNIGDKVIYDDTKSKKFCFDDQHDMLYKDKVLTGVVAATGEEGICVDFGEGFLGHTGYLPRDFSDEQGMVNYPNGYPDAQYLKSGKKTLWFFDYRKENSLESEFFTDDLILIPNK